MLERRRAIDARARQIVEESGVLWAVARDQAKMELGDDSILAARGAVPDFLTAVVITAISAALLVPVFYALAFVGLVNCDGFDTTGPYDIPCEQMADDGLSAWLAISAAGFVASAVLALTRRQPAWMAAPLLVGVTAAIVIGVVLVAAS